MKGKFIVLEGIDGSGKRSMCTRIATFLTEKGYPVRRFEYPDYTSPWGTIIHSFLSGQRELDVCTQFLTYATDIIKDQHDMKKSIEHSWILSDRYIPSTLAFQCARGFPREQARAFTEIFTFLPPDIIFFLDVDPEIGKMRKKKQKNNLDRHETDIFFLKKVNDMYYELLNQKFLTDNWITIDASRAINQVMSAILSNLKKIL